MGDPRMETYGQHDPRLPLSECPSCAPKMRLLGVKAIHNFPPELPLVNNVVTPPRKNDPVFYQQIRLLAAGWRASTVRDKCKECGEQFDQGVMVRRESTGFIAVCCATVFMQRRSTVRDFWDCGGSVA
ncbi:MAG: hypothetical protein ACRDRO_27640 [Pseudonocardiaceae bacterium]